MHQVRWLTAEEQGNSAQTYRFWRTLEDRDEDGGRGHVSGHLVIS